MCGDAEVQSDEKPLMSIGPVCSVLHHCMLTSKVTFIFYYRPLSIEQRRIRKVTSIIIRKAENGSYVYILPILAGRGVGVAVRQ